MRREESRRLLLLVLVSRDLLAEVLPLSPLLWPYVHSQSLPLLKAANQNRRALLLVLEAALPPASLVSLVLRRLVDVEVSTQDDLILDPASHTLQLLPQASPAVSRPRVSLRTRPSLLRASTPAPLVELLASTLLPEDRLRTVISAPRML